MYNLQTPAQLTAYLRALRKSRGLTQGALGSRVGVSAARISAIEHNPGAVSVGQLLQILYALGARVYLDVEPKGSESTSDSALALPTGEW